MIFIHITQYVNKQQNKRWIIENREIDFFQMGRGSRERGKEDKGEKGYKKRIEMGYVHIPTPHKEWKHYVRIHALVNNKK